jgi:uncharacterized lipoprotein YbaY
VAGGHSAHRSGHRALYGIRSSPAAAPRERSERRTLCHRRGAVRLPPPAYGGQASDGTAGSAGQSEIRVEGTIIYFERLALPPSATVSVTLLDTSRADAPATTLAAEAIGARQGRPFRFSLTVPRRKISAAANLTVSAQIRDGDRLLFRTTKAYPVPHEGATDLEVQLTFVGSPRGDAAPGVMTPSPTKYRCDGGTFQVAFETGRAYVTMPDGSPVTLQRQTSKADSEARWTYSNGRLTFMQEAEGATRPRVLFARGKSALTPCTRE